MFGLVGVPSPGPLGVVGGFTGPLGRNDLGSPLFDAPPGGTFVPSTRGPPPRGLFVPS